MLLVSSTRCRLFCFVLFCCPIVAAANGWEHTAIPASALMSALQSDDASLRQQAAHSLGHHRGEDIAKQLIGVIQRGEPESSVRQAVFASLGKMGARSALPVIEKCLELESEITVRVACASALSGIVSPASESIAHRFQNEINPAVQRAALASLGNYKTQKSLDALVAVLGSDDRRLQLTAMAALGRTGNADALESLVPVINARADEISLVTALKAIARIGGVKAPQVVQNLYDKTDNDRIRRYALIALAAFDSETNGLLKALSSDDPLLQIQALEIIRENGNKQDIDHVINLAEKHTKKFFDRPAAWVEKNPEQAVVELSVMNEFLRAVIAIDPHHAGRLFKSVAQPRSISRNRPIFLEIAEGLYRARWQGIYGIGYTHKGDVVNQVLDSGFA